MVNDTLRYKHGNGMSKVKIGKGTCIALSTFAVLLSKSSSEIVF